MLNYQRVGRNGSDIMTTEEVNVCKCISHGNGVSQVRTGYIRVQHIQSLWQWI